jgi:nitrous oxidase accessory protein NosD
MSDGSASVAIPVVIAQATPVTLQPGNDIAAAVNSFPAGTAFLLKSGMYRMQSIVPKAGDSFLGEPGTVLSGARVLTSFTREGAYWVAGGQAQEGPTVGLSNSPAQCSTGFPRCMRPEDLFFDDKPLLHVASLSNVSPGRWFFDYAADKIYFADDPTGRKVETSVTTQAFRATYGMNGVIIRGLTVEKYANPGQTGAVSGVDVARWTIEGNDIRLNHGTGVALTGGPNHRIASNNIHDNGQMGINGYNTDGLMIEANEIAYNNYAGYNSSWEAGGAKLTWSRTLTVRNNNAHHNRGNGLWTDTDNVNVLYDNNVASDNEGQGIFHEIGYDAVIRNNITERNTQHGILVDASPNVEVYGNTVRSNARLEQIMGRQATPVTQVGRYGALVLQNLYVHDNTIAGGGSGVSPMNQASGDTSFYTSRNNRFVHNTYDLRGVAAAPFFWSLASQTETAWKAYGQDATGIFTR